MNTVFYGAKFFTMADEMPVAEAVWVKDGRTRAVGKKDEVLSRAGGNAATRDLNGAAVYPGLIDSHLHILNHAITSHRLMLNGVRSRDEALRMLSERAKRAAAGEIICGRGFNEDLWADKRLPTRRELDLAAPGHAVLLTRVCGHLIVANSLTMEMAGVTRETVAPAGGWMDYENGFFAENALGLVNIDARDGGVERCKQLLYEGMSMAADAGLTAIFSDDIFTGGYSMESVLTAYRALEKEGRMPVRVQEQCAFPDEAGFRAFADAGNRYGTGGDYFVIGPRKLYADGSLGARTAWLSASYADLPDKRGVPIYPQERLNRLAAQAHESGFPFIVHAIGDAAAESVLDAVEYARKAVPGTENLRDGIVHCQITTEKTLSRIARLGVCVYAQPVFTEYDLHICASRVGEKHEKTSYNWKTLLDSGVCISAGSDCPVEPLEPAKNIYCAVTRKDFDGYPEGGWMPEQRLSVAEAVRLHTVLAAKSAGLEDRLGQIREGYFADFTVFPRALDEIAPEEILNQKPIMTVVGGKERLCPA